MPIAILLITSGAHCLSEDPLFHQQSILSPQLSRLLNLERAHVELSVRSLLRTHVFLVSILRSTPSDTPLKYRCLFKMSTRLGPITRVLDQQYGRS